MGKNGDIIKAIKPTNMEPLSDEPVVDMALDNLSQTQETGSDIPSIETNEMEERSNQLVFDFNSFLEKVDPLDIQPTDISTAVDFISRMEEINPAEASVMRKNAMDKQIPL